MERPGDTKDKGDGIFQEGPVPTVGDIPDATQDRWADAYTIVLVLILSTLGLTALASERDSGFFLVLILQGITLIVVFRVSLVPIKTIKRLAIAIITLIIMAGLPIVIEPESSFVSIAFGIVLLLLTAYGPYVIGRRLIKHTRIGFPTVMGALCIYLLLGMSFAVLFRVAATVEESAFFAGAFSSTPTDYLYFSFVTLTTVGYGDMSAATDIGRMIAVTEALIGQLYLVTVIALLVSNMGRERKKLSERD